MGNREIVARECDRANMVRRVCMASVDDRTFFHEIRGPLMISGLPAGEITLVGDLICEYAARNDMPTVVLTGRPEILGYLQELREEGSLPGTMISSPASRNYHPMYGLSRKQILQLFRRAGEEAGYGARFDDILPYAEAAITAAASRYPASLPAIHALLEQFQALDGRSKVLFVQGLSKRSATEGRSDRSRIAPSGDLDAACSAWREELDFWAQQGKPVMFTEYGADTVEGL